MGMPFAFFLRSVFEGFIADPSGPVTPIPGYELHFVLCPGFVYRGRTWMSARVIREFRCDDRAQGGGKYSQYDLGHGQSRAVLMLLLVVST